MIVHTKPPRGKTFTRFSLKTDAVAWMMKNKHRFLSCRQSPFGGWVINHYVR